MTYSFTPFCYEPATPDSLNSRFQDVVSGLNTLDDAISPATLTEIQNSVAEKLVDAASLMAWFASVKTDSTTTNDSSKLATAAAVYALKQLITANTSAISTINSLLTSDNVIGIADVDELQSALDNRLSKTITNIFSGTTVNNSDPHTLSQPVTNFTDIIIEFSDGFGFQIVTIPVSALRYSSTQWVYYFPVTGQDNFLGLRFLPGGSSFQASVGSGSGITRIFGRW